RERLEPPCFQGFPVSETAFSDSFLASRAKPDSSDAGAGPWTRSTKPGGASLRRSPRFAMASPPRPEARSIGGIAVRSPQARERGREARTALFPVFAISTDTACPPTFLVDVSHFPRQPTVSTSDSGRSSPHFPRTFSSSFHFERSSKPPLKAT